MKGDFLVLSLLCCIPGIFIYVCRRDLRTVIHTVSIVAVPFAFTERFFYPTYWEPFFLWDLANKIGFGIEDIIFVAGLGALTSTVYAFVFRKKFSDLSGKKRKTGALYSVAVLALAALLVVFARLTRVPMIYASLFIMFFISVGILYLRKDLILPAIIGGGITCMVYSLICILFSVLFKNVFHVVWHGEKFSNIFIMGILLEELLYGFAAGVAGTIFYPFITRRRFVS